MAQDRPIGNMKFGIGFDGFDESLNTLDKLNKALKQSESSMKATMSTFDKASLSAEDLDKKQQGLTQTTELQAKKIQLLEKRREEYIQTYGKESKQVASVTTQINNATVKYNKLAKELDSTKQSYIVASSGVDKYSKAIKENEQAMNEEIKAFKESGDKAGELEAKQRGLAKQAELTEQAITAQKQAISKMAQEFGESSTQVKQAEAKLQSFQNSAKNTDTRLEGVSNALSELKTEASGVDDKIDKAGDSLEEVGKKGEDAGSGFKDATKEFGALATGLSVAVATKALDIIIEGATAVKDAINDAVDATSKLTGKLGLADGEAKPLINMANEIVGSGLAETLDEAQEAMALVVQQAGKKVHDPIQIKEMTENALSLTNMFGGDLNENIRGVTRMMENFGLSSEQAFDLLVRGSQRGLDQSGELADNMAEYSQLWAQMGYDAEETFSILEAGLDGGAYNLDKVNDLVKEMGISLTDGRFEENADMFSESTRNLFNEWKEGRATQKDVVQGMLQDFSKMDNGYEALNKAGTVWSALGEDNSLKMIKAMAGAQNSYNNVQGAAEELNDTAGNTTPWEAFQNGVKQALGNVGLYFAQLNDGKATEWIENFFSNTLPQWGNNLATFAGDVNWFVTIFTNSMGAIGDALKKMWSEEFKPSDYTLLNAMGIDTDTIWMVEDHVTKLKENVDKVTGYIKGFWQLMSPNEGTQMQGYSLLRSLGMSQEDIENLEATAENVGKTLTTIKDLAVDLAVKGIDKMVQSWNDLYAIWEEYIAPDLMPLFSQFAGWLQRLTGDITTITGALDKFGGSSQSNSNIVIQAFGVMWEGVKVKLGLIMATIETAMIIISSTIKIWSNIFKGDWGAAWEEIKRMYERIANAIWQGIKNTFLGDIIRTLGEFFTKAWEGFTGWFERTKNGVTGFLDNIVQWFKDLPNRIAEGFKAGGNVISDAFKSVFNGALRAIGKPVNGIIKGASWVLEKLGAEPLKEWEVPQYATGTPNGGHPGGPMMVNDGRGAEAVITPNGQAFIPKGRNVVMNAPKGTHVLTAEETAYMTGNKAPKYRYKKGTNFFGNLWDNVKGFAGDVGSKLKNTIGDVWEFVSDPGALAKKVLGGLGVLEGLTKYPLDVGKGILSKATSALTDKITGLFSSGNLDTSIGTNGVYKYLADVAKSVMAKFPGFVATSGYRPGDPYSHGKRNAIDIALPGVTGGSPKYAEAANYAFEKFASKVGYVITNGKVRDRSGQSGTGIHDDWRPWPDGDHYDHVHINGVKDPQDTQISGENFGGSGVERWRGIATQALRMTGQYSTANLNALLNQMRTESNGDPRAINNWDINAKNGTPSKGLMQVIDPTFRAYALPPHNSNIYDPLSNILASIRYAVSRYGSLTAAYRGVGYENGGIVKKQHLAMVGEGNKEEVVIPLTGSGLKRSRALSLLAYAQEKLNQQSQPTVTAETSGNNDLGVVVALLQQQNELLQAILAKDTNVLLDGTKVNSKLEKIRATQQRNANRDLGLV